MALTTNNLFQLQGQNPHMATLGEMADISNLCQFGWYQWVYFRQHTEKFPHQKEVLGRCLGPTKDEGNEMAQWILQENAQIVPRRTLRKLREEELSPNNLVEGLKRKNFDDKIKGLLVDSLHTPKDLPVDNLDTMNNFDYGEPDDLAPDHVIPAAEAVDTTGKPINQQSVADLLINAEVLLGNRDTQQMARVLRRSLDADGKVIGELDGSLNSLIYDVEFPDGAIKRYAANLIAENVLSQVDTNRYHSQSLLCISQHEVENSAVKMKDGYFTTNRGVRARRQTTAGWRFLVEWKDRTSSWCTLKVLKESNPIEVAEYVTAAGIQDEPAFTWWVPYTLRKRDCIISSISSRVRKRNRKFGIEMPTSVEEVKALDLQNGNTLWKDALDKEMYQVGVAFKILEHDEQVPVGYAKSSSHIVFDVTMDFTRKAR